MATEQRLIDANKVAQDVRENNKANFFQADWSSKRVCELLESAPPWMPLRWAGGRIARTMFNSCRITKNTDARFLAVAMTDHTQQNQTISVPTEKGELRMTFDKPPEWGKRFNFPENIQIEYNGYSGSVASEIAVKMAERYEDAVIEQIAMEAKAAGISDLTVLNKAMILEAIEKQVPQKPERAIVHDDELWKKAMFRCPRCVQHLLVAEAVARPDHGFERLKQEDKSPFCRFCGPALDWGDPHA